MVPDPLHPFVLKLDVPIATTARQQLFPFEGSDAWEGGEEGREKEAVYMYLPSARPLVNCLSYHNHSIYS